MSISIHAGEQAFRSLNPDCDLSDMHTFPSEDGDLEPRSSWLAIGCFLVLFLVSSIVGYQVHRHLVESEERDVRDALTHIAEIQSASISTWIFERISDGIVFSGGRFLGDTMAAWLARGAPDDETKRQMQEQLKSIRGTYQYTDAALLDPIGTVRISALGEPFIMDPEELATARRALHTSSVQLSPLRTIAATPANHQIERIVDIAAPLFNSDEEQAATPPVLLLRAQANLNFAPFAHTPPIEDTETEVLLAEIQEGKVTIASSNQKVSYFGHADVLPITPDQLIASIKTPSTTFSLPAANGESLVATTRQVEKMPWFLVAVVNDSAVRSRVKNIAWMVVGAGAGILSLLGIVVLLWWREKRSQFHLRALEAKTERQLLQRKYDYLSKYANDMILLIDADARIIDVNDKASQVFDRQRAEMIGQPLNSFFSPSCKSILDQAFEKLLREGIAMFEIDCERADPTTMAIEVSARAIDLGGTKLIQLIGRNITERKEAERALRESQNRLNGILDSILDVVWSVSPDFVRMHYINQSIERISGYPTSIFVENAHFWLDMIHPEDLPHVMQSLKALSPEHCACETEFRIIRRNGEARWLHCRGHLVCDAQDRPLRIDGVATDITQRKQAEQQVETLAYYDNVTKLPNRTLLLDRLAQAMHMGTRSKKKVALLFMDLDNFKNINDSLGHDVGDMLLRATADRLTQCVREEDTVARIGGDEFLVVLPDIDRGEQAAAVAEKILVATSLPFQLQENEIYSTISIGVSVFPDDGRDAQELIKHADTALYQAKGQGRDRYQFFTRELNQQIIRSSRIERQLRQAIDSGALSLWYQPQIDATQGKLIGAEALLRWRQDGRDFLSPVEFIPVAEERGLIGKIGEWVLREACAQCRRWQDEGLLLTPIAVNVSPIQFQQKGFATLVTDILRETQLDAKYLELEITESAIMRRASVVAELAMRLRTAGVGISIDDFGTGYSSLSYLRQIPIDKIKIDRSFISAMLTHGDDEAITYAIINLAHSLNLRVIAEGVESRAQLDRLRVFGCNEIQGHYYSSAVSAEKFRDFLANQRVFVELTSF